MVVDLIHDGSFGYIQQYGRVETVYDQGSFDFSIIFVFPSTKYELLINISPANIFSIISLIPIYLIDYIARDLIYY